MTEMRNVTPSASGNGNLGQQATVGTPSTQPPPSSSDNSSLHQPPDRFGSALPGRASPARVPPRGGAAPLPAFYSHSPPTRQVGLYSLYIFPFTFLSFLINVLYILPSFSISFSPLYLSFHLSSIYLSIYLYISLFDEDLVQGVRGS